MSPSPRSPDLARWRRRPGQPPTVLGHRGARREAPENTLQAFELAVKQGAAGVELDVRLDADGQVIVLHDRTLSRVTAGRDDRDVETLGGSELGRVELEGGAAIPTLRDVLAWARAGDHLVNVELKRDVGSRRALVWRVARLLRAEPRLSGRLLLSSFDPLMLRAMAWLLPGMPLGWLVHAKQRALRSAPGWRRVGVVAVHPELALASDARVRRLHAGGALVSVWTVNEPADAERLARAGADVLISDVPGVIVGALSGTPARAGSR